MRGRSRRTFAPRRPARVSAISFYGHSFGRATVTQTRMLYQRRVAEQLGAAHRDFHVSGSDMLDVGAAAGGFVTQMQLDEPLGRAYGAQSYPPRPGTAVWMTGINGVQAYATDADWAQLKAAFVHNYRAVTSWQQLSGYWHHDEASTGQAFAGSGWATSNFIVGLEGGPGSNFRNTASSGATWTITTSTTMAGKAASLFFLTNRTGGAIPASSISITLDGQAHSTLDTRNVNPASTLISGIAVARVALPDDGAQHTIVATSGTGGMALVGWGVESPRLFIVANVARRSDGGYTPNGSDAKVTELNTAIAGVVAEFGAPVYVANIDGVLGAAAENFADGLHPNDKGHELMAREVLRIIDNASLTAQQRGLL